MDPKLQAQLLEMAQKNQQTHAENQEVIASLRDRLSALEQKGVLGTLDVRSGTPPTVYDTVIKADGWSAFAAGNSKTFRATLPAGQLETAMKTAIVNATQNTSQPLVQGMRVPGIVYEPQRVLSMMDLLPQGNTNSNLIEFTKENVFTNNAGPQYASPARENVTKPESGITFTLETAPVITFAHWLPISKQVFDDSPSLASYLGPRLLYGLALKVDDAILNGQGTAGTLNGILKSGNFTAYNRTVSGDTYIDTVGRAIIQLALNDYTADAVIVNPADLEVMRHQKDQENRYIMGDPAASGLVPSLWGVRVIASNQIAPGTFLVGSFAMGAQLWNRQQAAIEMSREDGNNFTKNMVTVLAELRLALTVYRPKAFVSGSF